MKTINLKVLSKYEDMYVAWSKRTPKILASGKTIKELEKKLQKIKAKEAIIDFIPPLNVSLSLLCQ